MWLLPLLLYLLRRGLRLHSWLRMEKDEKEKQKKMASGVTVFLLIR
jgi:hypothetical protein